jgi:transposase InsO family protein
MNFVLQPWQLLLLILAGWINRKQQNAIDYLKTENEVLREKLGKKRILLTNDQRRRLAARGKVLGRKALREINTVFTPDTILRWHRQLVAQKWDYSDRRRRVGRPRIGREVVELVLRVARENARWGYDRIQGALANLGYKISDTTVGNILRDHGIEPAPRRKSQATWHEFLKSHWDVLAAIDFTTIEIWTKSGLVTFYLLFVIEQATRKVQFAGCTTNPNEVWMEQIARNLTDSMDGFLENKRYLIMDRDDKYCRGFREIVEQTDVKCLRLPPRSPNLNPHMERYLRSLKEECLNRMILFGEKSLRKAIEEFISHYHVERNHQGLNNRLIEPENEVGQVAGRIECRERLGGMLRYYYRRAA